MNQGKKTSTKMMPPTKAIRCARILAFLSILCSPQRIDSLPMLVVKSTKNKCATVTAPKGTKISVEFYAPDLFADGRHPTDSPAYVTIMTKVVEPADAAWKSKIQNRLQISKEDINSNKGRPQTQRLDTERGAIPYEVPSNGEVSVCIRAMGASSKRPMRFGLRIDKQNEIEAREMEANARDAVDHHLTHIEIEMRHLKVSMGNIISEADFSKERETKFHQQTLSMHSASMWWPIVQVCVLLLTGFTQANHVVRFLKTKHLI